MPIFHKAIPKTTASKDVLHVMGASERLYCFLLVCSSLLALQKSAECSRDELVELAVELRWFQQARGPRAVLGNEGDAVCCWPGCFLTPT